MYKNATYKEKFAELQEWIPYLVEEIKKDLKNEHLKKDMYFVKKFFPNTNLHKVTTGELAQVYQKAIQEEEQGEELAEFISSRWLLKNSDLYEFFEQRLSQINPDFSHMEEMSHTDAQGLIDQATQEFGAPQTYLFSVLNSVVFPKESFHRLKVQAQEQQEISEQEAQQTAEQTSVEQIAREFEREKARLVDKYEKKIAGLQRKYITDVDNLKKQLANLQRKLQHEKKG